MASSVNSIQEIVALIEACMRRHFGQQVRVENATQATLGGSNRTIVFDLLDGSKRRKLVSRQETYTLDTSPFLAPEMQFQILKLAFRYGLTVPEPVVEYDEQDGLGRGHIVAFVEGETLPKRILNDEAFTDAREIFAQQVGEFLARLHAIPHKETDFLTEVEDSKDPLDAQRKRYDYYAEPHPVVDYAFNWLATNRPANARRCLVHGDFRVGNMLINAQGLSAVLDWECAYLGDPMADLGWLSTPAWRFGNMKKPVAGIAESAALYRAYEQAGGESVQEEAVRWWQVFGSLRWTVINIMQVHGHRVGGRRSPAFAACGRNTALIEHELLLGIAGGL